MQKKLTKDVKSIREDVDDFPKEYERFAQEINGNITEFYRLLKETLMPLVREQVELSIAKIHADYDKKFEQQINQLHSWMRLILIITILVLIVLPLAEHVIKMILQGNKFGIIIMICGAIITKNMNNKKQANDVKTTAK